MSALAPSTATSNPTPGFPGVLFGRNADNMLVARVGDHAFAMVPGRNGKYFLASGWRIGRPLEQWRRGDFYGHSGELADAAAFRAKVMENAVHQQEKSALGRQAIRSSASTPWGPSQGAIVYAEGVTCHSTAGHGGFHLSAERNRRVHAMLRVRSGWYEEDAEWAIVALSFPHLFTTFERWHADRTVKDSRPDAWEAIFGTTLAPGESYTKDRRIFEAKHTADWIVVSAITSDHHKGFVETVATPGGQSRPGTAERRFLVPSDEYDMGRFGFVIDPDRHAGYDGPSSFVGWHGGER